MHYSGPANYFSSLGKNFSSIDYYGLVNEGINAEISQDNRNEIVFIKEMLADEINAGYSADNYIVTKVNDVDISSLKDFATFMYFAQPWFTPPEQNDVPLEYLSEE